MALPYIGSGVLGSAIEQIGLGVGAELGDKLLGALGLRLTVVRDE